MVPLKHGGSTVSIICGLTERLLRFQFNPRFSFAESVVLVKHITVALQGKEYNHVEIGRYEEVRVHFHQILMDNSGSELQLGGEVNSKVYHYKMQSCLKLDMLKSKHSRGDTVSKNQILHGLFCY